MGTSSQLENSFYSQGFFGSLDQYGCQVPLKPEIELKRDEWTMMEVEKVTAFRKGWKGSQKFILGIWNYFETYSCDYREALVPCRLLVGDFN